MATLVPTYLRLIPKLKVLVYNGDIDPCVPYNGNEEWTRGLVRADTPSILLGTICVFTDLFAQG